MQKTRALHVGEKEIIQDKTTLRIIGMAFFLILTICGAFVYIPLPFTPVPITLQTFFVLLSAIFLSKKDAMFTQGTYIGLGIAGLPIFSSAQGGILKLFGPTGGYIIGFIMAIFVVNSVLDSRSKGKRCGFLSVLSAMSLGMITIYFFGGAWLNISLRLSFAQVMSLGVIPFLPGAVLKTVLAAFIYTKANARMQSLFKES